MLETGELKRLIKEDAVVGVTSNPTIFQKAMAEGDWYDEQLAEAMKQTDDPKELFLALAMEDIRDACDVLHPVWKRADGVDGYVSLEVDPTLAYDREATSSRRCGSTPRSTSRTSTSRSRRRRSASARSRTASRRRSRST